EGLADWSVEAGYVRSDYGIRSFGYEDDPVVSGTLRYGLTKALTVETHAESTSDLTLGGLGAPATLGRLGQLAAAYAIASGAGEGGSQYSAGYQWAGKHFNARASTTRAEDQYRDIAALHGAPPPTVTDSLSLGLSFQSLGTMSLSYVRQKYPDE